MKKKISIILLVISFCINAMDAPGTSETVPVKLHDTYSKEQKKFTRYQLDDPKIFLQNMRKQFNYDGDKEQYLKKVQALASVLLAQHQALKYLGETTFFTNYHYTLKDRNYQLLKMLHSKPQPGAELVELIPETAEQLNILLVHSKIASDNRVFTDEELPIIFSWILDKDKGAWLNNLGLLQKNVHEASITNNKARELRNLMENSIMPLLDSPFRTTEKLTQENAMYAAKIFAETNALKNIHKTSSPEVIERASRQYQLTLAQLAQLYRTLQPSYQKLYSIVRKELYETFNQAIKAGIKNITPALLLPIPEQLRKANNIPAKFPEELGLIANPTSYLAHASLDTQLEQARQEWERSHATPKPKLKKKIRRKKVYSALGLAESRTETLEIEPIVPSEEVKKIKVGTDGSYIAANAEDDLQIIIEDPVQDTTVTIFKTKSTPENNAKLKALPKINYTPWVTEWFENPEKAILTHGYKDPKNLRYRAGESDWLPIVLHAFPRLVDEYIYQYGSVSQTPSRKTKGKNDIMVTIPGKMEYPDGKEETGVFTYLIDQDNGQWFHRMFTPSSHKKMAADFIEKGYFAPEVKGYYEVYFPPLTK